MHDKGSRRQPRCVDNDACEHPKQFPLPTQAHGRLGHASKIVQDMHVRRLLAGCEYHRRELAPILKWIG